MDKKTKARLAYVLNLVMAELVSASEKHPAWPVDDLRRAVVVAEEANELLKEALSLREFQERNPSVQTATEFTARMGIERNFRMNMQREAAQAAAMAIRYLMNHSPEPLVMTGDEQKN